MSIQRYTDYILYVAESKGLIDGQYAYPLTLKIERQAEDLTRSREVPSSNL